MQAVVRGCRRWCEDADGGARMEELVRRPAGAEEREPPGRGTHLPVDKRDLRHPRKEEGADVPDDKVQQRAARPVGRHAEFALV